MASQYKKQLPSSKKYGDFVIFYQYAEIEGNQTACMVIGCPRRRSAYMIPEKNAHLYADSITGEPTDKLIQLAITIADAIGLGADRYNTYRIASAVVDNLPDLIEMPPAPMLTQKDIEQKAERQGLVVKQGEQTLIDAG